MEQSSQTVRYIWDTIEQNKGDLILLTYYNHSARSYPLCKKLRRVASLLCYPICCARALKSSYCASFIGKHSITTKMVTKMTFLSILWLICYELCGKPWADLVRTQISNFLGCVNDGRPRCLLGRSENDQKILRVIVCSQKGGLGLVTLLLQLLHFV